MKSWFLVVGLNLAVAVLVAWVGWCLLTSCSPASCAKYGTLELEYKRALDDACGDLKEAECNERRPGAVEAVDERFRPQFEEAESCRAR